LQAGSRVSCRIAREPKARGCLSVNAATDGVLDQPEYRDSIDRYNARLEELIRLRLETDRTQFSNDFDPKAAAHFIMTVSSGLMA
jgi:hypothetical protein